MRVRYTDEQKDYIALIGPKEYKRKYARLYTQAKYTSNSRYSGRRYDNPPEKITEMKEKYKNGVTREILDEMF